MSRTLTAFPNSAQGWRVRRATLGKIQNSFPSPPSDGGEGQGEEAIRSRTAAYVCHPCLPYRMLAPGGPGQIRAKSSPTASEDSC